jgi:hypothetical protein
MKVGVGVAGETAALTTVGGVVTAAGVGSGVTSAG